VGVRSSPPPPRPLRLRVRFRGSHLRGAGSSPAGATRAGPRHSAVGELGRPRRFHTPKIVGSNPTCATGPVSSKGRMRGCYPRHAGSSPAAGARSSPSWLSGQSARLRSGRSPVRLRPRAPAGMRRPVAHRQSGAFTRRAWQVRLLLGRPRPPAAGNVMVVMVSVEAHRVVVPEEAGSNPPDHPESGRTARGRTEPPEERKHATAVPRKDASAM
jgi:hypothetical protein